MKDNKHEGNERSEIPFTRSMKETEKLRELSEAKIPFTRSK